MARDTVEDLEAQLRSLAAGFQERMLDRGFTVGSNSVTAPVIEHSFLRSIELLETHLSGRSFLLGGSPSMADFGLAAQLYQMLCVSLPPCVNQQIASLSEQPLCAAQLSDACVQDPTAGELMRLHTPEVCSSGCALATTHVCVCSWCYGQRE